MPGVLETRHRAFFVFAEPATAGYKIICCSGGLAWEFYSKSGLLLDFWMSRGRLACEGNTNRVKHLDFKSKEPYSTPRLFLQKPPRREPLLRFAAVALPGQTFVFPLEGLRWRAGFVGSGATCANKSIRL
jgi:hypothetical protein